MHHQFNLKDSYTQRSSLCYAPPIQSERQLHSTLLFMLCTTNSIWKTATPNAPIYAKHHQFNLKDSYTYSTLLFMLCTTNSISKTATLNAPIYAMHHQFNLKDSYTQRSCSCYAPPIQSERQLHSTLLFMLCTTNSISKTATLNAPIYASISKTATLNAPIYAMHHQFNLKDSYTQRSYLCYVPPIQSQRQLHSTRLLFMLCTTNSIWKTATLNAPIYAICTGAICTTNSIWKTATLNAPKHNKKVTPPLIEIV